MKNVSGLLSFLDEGERQNRHELRYNVTQHDGDRYFGNPNGQNGAHNGWQQGVL
jgi:hypothetical protein